jgi:hypothetical protein
MRTLQPRQHIRRQIILMYLLNELMLGMSGSRCSGGNVQKKVFQQYIPGSSVLSFCSTTFHS